MCACECIPRFGSTSAAVIAVNRFRDINELLPRGLRPRILISGRLFLHASNCRGLWTPARNNNNNGCAFSTVIYGFYRTVLAVGNGGVRTTRNATFPLYRSFAHRESTEPFVSVRFEHTLRAKFAFDINKAEDISAGLLKHSYIKRSIVRIGICTSVMLHAPDYTLKKTPPGFTSKVRRDRRGRSVAGEIGWTIFGSIFLGNLYIWDSKLIPNCSWKNKLINTFLMRSKRLRLE